MKTFRIDTIDDPVEAGLAHAAALDLPRHGQQEPPSGTVLSGWLLSAEGDTNPPNLILEADGRRQVIPLNVDRPDVISKVLSKSEDGRLRCGFKLVGQTLEAAQLAIEKDGRRIVWKKIDSVIAEWSPDAVALAEVLGGPQNSNTDKMNGAVERLQKRTIQSLVHVLENRVLKISPSALPEALSTTQRTFLVTFLEFLRNKDTLLEWFRGAIEQNKITAPNALDSGYAYASASLYTDSKINLLFFDSESEPFVVLQHVSFADAVYFTRLGYLHIFEYLAAGSILNGLAEAATWLVRNNGRIAEDRKFGGAISGSTSPYHFFYNSVSAMQLLDDGGCLKRIPCILHAPGSIYAEPSEMFEVALPLHVETAAHLRERALIHGEFHCQLGLRLNRLTSIENDKLDSRVQGAALRKYGVPQKITAAKSLRIWWGVTGQKRSWKEQVEGTAYVLDQIAEAYPGLEVVFDGWTSPIDPGPRDEQEIQNDEAVVQSIIKLMRNQVVTSSVIGKSSLEKTSVAMGCDAFVANYATGSIHVSRFAGRPGVVHLNTMMPKFMHIQHRTVCVPAKRTTDLVEADDQRADFVSYSIDPKDILFLLESVIAADNS